MNTLDKLRELRDLKTQERGLIAEARREGYDWATICEASGVIRQTAIFYAKEANGGVLPVAGDDALRELRKSGKTVARASRGK